MRGDASTGGVLLYVLVRWVKRTLGIAVFILIAKLYFVPDYVGSTAARNQRELRFSPDQGFFGSSAGFDVDHVVASRSGGAADRHLSGRSNSRSLSNSTSASSACGHNKDHASQTEYSLEGTLSFLITCFLLCAFLDHLNLLIPFNMRYPISAIMFIFGKVFCYFIVEIIPEVHGLHTAWVGINSASHMNPHAVFYILLPPLLYESASSLDWFVFKKVLPSSVLLALPGVLLNVGLTTLLVYFLFDLKASTGEDLNLEASLLLSTILSATDPVAVVATLHVLGAPKKLAHLIEGESLLNDGSAVVFFFVFLDMVATGRPDNKKQCTGTPPAPHCVILYFLRLAVGGVALGFLIGFFLSFWVRRVAHLGTAPLQVVIVLCAVYGSFFLAEALHLSGVLAVVTLGTMMSAAIHPRLSHEGRHYHHIVLQEIGYMCNMCIFFTAGLVSTRFMFLEKAGCGSDPLYKTPRAWGELCALYIWIHVTRLLVVVAFSPILKRIGYGFKWKEAAILVYGGLRGAVGLAMGLMVEHDEYVDRRIAAQIAFHTSGIVLATLCINGSTVDELYRKLQPYPPNPFRLNHIRKVLCTVEEACRKAGIQELYRHWFFHDVQFCKILSCVPHFGHIEFESSGVAMPKDIQAVPVVLRALAASAIQFCENQSGRQSRPLSTFGATDNKDDTFEERWRRRKEDLEDKCRSWLSHSMPVKRIGVEGDQSSSRTLYHDQLQGTECTGKQQLTFEGKDDVGVYVSAIPISDIMRKGQDYVSVKILRCENVSIQFGVFLNTEGTVRVIPPNTDKLLGVAPGSVAFDCSSGRAHYNLDGEEPGVCDTGVSGVCPGKVVELRVKQDYNSNYRIAFGIKGDEHRSSKKTSSVRTRSLSATPLRPFDSSDDCDLTELYDCADEDLRPQEIKEDNYISLGTATLQDAYPVIEFRTVSYKSASSPKAQGSDIASDPCKENAGRRPKRLKSLSQLSVPTSLITKSGKVAASGFEDSERCEGKVSLSFEPSIATDDESLSETFQVLFNTVMHHYEEMHSDGILSDDALHWVVDAVNKGVDCLNREINAVNVSSFRGLEQIQVERQFSSSSTSALKRKSTRQSMMASVGVDAPTSRPSVISRPSCSRPSQTLVTGVPGMPSMPPLPDGDLSPPPPMDPHPSDTFVTSALEPLVVEYLVLEHECAQKSWFEIFPASWTWIRHFAFSRTRAKIECLWAFIEAHQGTMKNFPALRQRFPEIASCMQDLIEEAKRDLQILEELRPRRFFFCKHYLALRFLMNKRLSRLKTFIKQGWISYSDTEGLIHSFQERIAMVERFVPSSGLYKSHGGDRGVHPDCPDHPTAEAWADEDLELERNAAFRARPSLEEIYARNTHVGGVSTPTSRGVAPHSYFGRLTPQAAKNKLVKMFEEVRLMRTSTGNSFTREESIKEEACSSIGFRRSTPM